MDIDNSLKNIFNREDFERKRAEADSLFEEKVLAKILSIFNLDTFISKARSELKRIHGISRPNVTFAYFYNEYPSFPIWLKFERLYVASKVRLSDMFNDFTKNPIFKGWERARVDCPDESKPVGLIFSLPKVKGRHLIISDYPSNTRNTDLHETIINHIIGTNKKCTHVQIERLSRMTERLLADWAI